MFRGFVENQQEIDPFLKQNRHRGRSQILVIIALLITINITAVYFIREEEFNKSNRYETQLRLLQTKDGLADKEKQMSLKNLLDNIVSTYDNISNLGNLTFFRSYSDNKIVKWFRTKTDGRTDDKTIGSLDNLPFGTKDSIALKNYIKFTNEIGFEIQNFSTSDELYTTEKSCYNWRIKITYQLARQQMASKNINLIPTQCDYLSSQNYFAKNYYVFAMFFVQLLLVGYLQFESVSNQITIMITVQSIKLKLKGLCKDVIPLNIDYGLYRMIRPIEHINLSMTDKEIISVSKIFIASKIIRPLFWFLILGYLVQIVSVIFNMICIIINDQITHSQKQLISQSIFFAWMDCYSVSSISNQGGVLSKTLLSTTKQIAAISLGVLIIFAAFVIFATCLYQTSDNFSNFGSSSVSIFSIAFGDSIRDNLDKIKFQPFTQIFTIICVLVFYSSVVQVYVAIYIEMYQKKLVKQEDTKVKDQNKKRELDELEKKMHARKTEFMYDREQKNLSKIASNISKAGTQNKAKASDKRSLIGNTLIDGKSVKGFNLDLRDINKSISGFGGMNDSLAIKNMNDTTNKIGFALKNELASPTKKLPILRKNSISEKSEENRKSVESDLKKDLNQFKIAKLGNFGDEFLSPNAQGENAMDTIRRLSERNISEKKRKLSISNQPQDQMKNQNENSEIGHDTLSISLDQNIRSKINLYNSLLHSYTVDMLIDLKIISESQDEFITEDKDNSEETHKIVVILLENLKQIILRFEYFKKSF